MNRNAVMALFFALFLFAPAAFARDYTIAPGDILRIDVWSVPDLSGEVVVRPDGKITIPAVGEVEVAGKAPTEVSKILAAAMNQFVKQPLVTVAVRQITNNKIYLSGGVANQIVTLPGPTTLFKFMAGVGSLAAADLRNAYVARGGKEVFRDFYKLIHDGDLSLDIALEADDVVFVPANDKNKIYTIGAVIKPSVIPFKEDFTILDAILSSDGFSQYADKESITLVRPGQDPKVISSTILYKDPTVNVKLKPGDYVVVPSFETDRIYVSGEVAKPLYLTYDRKMRVLDAICAAGGFTERADSSSVVVLGPGKKKTVIDLEDVAKGNNLDNNIPLEPGDHVVVNKSFF